jgi:hypothetical protein
MTNRPANWRSRGNIGRLSNGRDGTRTQRLSCPDVVLDEFPNHVTPLSKKRDLTEALAEAERGKRTMSTRHIYQIKNEIANHDCMALEVEWVGTRPYPSELFR